VKSLHHRNDLADSQYKHIEADLEAGVSELFRRCPTLCGFSVRDQAGLIRDGIPLEHASDLYITEVSVYPMIGLEAPRDVCVEIAKVLIELIDERPEASSLLRERAYARVFH